MYHTKFYYFKTINSYKIIVQIFITFYSVYTLTPSTNGLNFITLLV